jgi:hypothetical protein
MELVIVWNCDLGIRISPSLARRAGTTTAELHAMCRRDRFVARQVYGASWHDSFSNVFIMLDSSDLNWHGFMEEDLPAPARSGLANSQRIPCYWQPPESAPVEQRCTSTVITSIVLP